VKKNKFICVFLFSFAMVALLVLSVQAQRFSYSELTELTGVSRTNYGVTEVEEVVETIAHTVIYEVVERIGVQPYTLDGSVIDSLPLEDFPGVIRFHASPVIEHEVMPFVNKGTVFVVTGYLQLASGFPNSSEASQFLHWAWANADLLYDPIRGARQYWGILLPHSGRTVRTSTIGPGGAVIAVSYRVEMSFSGQVSWWGI